MKNILIITLLIFTTLSCKAQIIPIEDDINYRTNEIEIPDGAHIKDINNLFDKYIGTWTGTINDKNYEFIVSEYTESFLGISKDRLVIRYKITDGTFNQMIVDTSTLPNGSPLVIEGNYLDINGDTYHLDYYGFDAKCGQNGYISIAVINNGTQMNLGYSINGEISVQDCPNTPVEQVMPTFITLDKQ